MTERVHERCYIRYNPHFCKDENLLKNTAAKYAEETFEEYDAEVVQTHIASNKIIWCDMLADEDIFSYYSWSIKALRVYYWNSSDIMANLFIQWCAGYKVKLPFSMVVGKRFKRFNGRVSLASREFETVGRINIFRSADETAILSMVKDGSFIMRLPNSGVDDAFKPFVFWPTEYEISHDKCIRLIKNIVDATDSIGGPFESVADGFRSELARLLFESLINSVGEKI